MATTSRRFFLDWTHPQCQFDGLGMFLITLSDKTAHPQWNHRIQSSQGVEYTAWDTLFSHFPNGKGIFVHFCAWSHFLSG